MEPQPATASKSAILDSIKELAKLRDAAILTEPEFEAKKVELLGRYDTAPDADAPSIAAPDFAWPASCDTCGGNGVRLPGNTLYCPDCRWLRPLVADYELDRSRFMWALDEQAMGTLQSLGPLSDAAHGIAERYGRRWFEAAVNGVRLTERQLPDIHRTAVRAARVLAMPYMPEVYVAGDQMWDCLTLGSNDRAFIVLGSVLTNFTGDDLAFLLAREMGHIRAGHAMWKTALQFLTGRGNERRTVMGDGVLQFLNPVKIVENAVDLPLMAWARHAEITADRAGILAVGSIDVARRVLLMCTLRSFPLYPRLDQAAWLEQEDAADSDTSKFAERTMSTVPFIAPRLRLLREFARSDDVVAWRTSIAQHLPLPERPMVQLGRPNRRPAAPEPVRGDTIRLVCVKCRKPMRIPAAALAGKLTVTVRCAAPECRALLTVSSKRSVPDAHTTE